jgi:hypothetical protein
LLTIENTGTKSTILAITHTKSSTLDKTSCFSESRLVIAVQATFSFEVLSREAIREWRTRVMRREAMIESLEWMLSLILESMFETKNKKKKKEEEVDLLLKYVVESGGGAVEVGWLLVGVCWWFVSWHGCLRLDVPQQALLHKASGTYRRWSGSLIEGFGDGSSGETTGCG